MALWEVPNRMASSVERSVGALNDLPEDLRGLQGTLTSIDDTLRALLAAVIPLRDDMATLEERSRHLHTSVAAMEEALARSERSLGPSATDQFTDVQQRLGRLESLIAHIDDRIPDPDEPSPIVKAKDALLGQDNDEPKR